MKDIFNLNRFGKLLRKEISERIPVIIKIAAILSLILIGFWLTYLVIDDNPMVSSNNRFIYLYLAAYFTAVMAPFNLYKSFNHHKKGLDYITLPASVQEKFLSMILVSFVVMPLIVFLSIMATDTMISIVNPSVFKGFIFSNLNESPFINNSNASITDFMILPLFCLLGNLLFRGNKIVKTFLSFAGIYILLVLIVSFLFLYVFKNQVSEIQGAQIKITVDNLADLYRNNLFDDYPLIRITAAILSVLYSIGFPVGAFVGAYYRMKNLQY